MSDPVAQQDDTLEPDEETLISALRNQDDIPILMDIVGEQLSAGVSQEEYLSKSIDEVHESAKLDASSNDYSRDAISKTIAEVLEKRLPELVAEVVDALDASLPSKD